MLIDAKDITVVLQGDLRVETEQVIRSIRDVLPGARLVLSTFDTEAFERFTDDVDELVLSRDPGAMPPFVMANNAAPNNTNRQLVSSQAGLGRVATPYALKMRTDCILSGNQFVRLFEKLGVTDSRMDRLVVSSFFTRHPRGLACYLFHVSDWFVFGRTERVRLFFSAPMMNAAEAAWFESRPHLESGTYAARRFRARFTPEQHITTHFARVLGYETPAFLNDSTPALRLGYEAFLAKEVIVARPSDLGFSIGKYQATNESLYQRIDCVSLADWLDLYESHCGKSVPAATVARDWGVIPKIRRIANPFRHAVIRTVLGVKGLRLPRGTSSVRRKRLACLLTGVPRGSALCLESLRFLIQDFDVTYFAAYREEFDDPSVREMLATLLPGVRIIVVPTQESLKAVSQVEGKARFNDTLVKMWHEVWYAEREIPSDEFDLVLRTRFDIFFSRMRLFVPALDDRCVLLPAQMSWSGSNDMLALALPNAFKRYAGVYHHLTVIASQGVSVPEMVMACALSHAGLEERRLELLFALYRAPLMSDFSLTELSVLAWRAADSSTFKIGSSEDTPQSRRQWAEQVGGTISRESLFPTYQITGDANFYPIEIDPRDNTPFRFMGLHAFINRAFHEITAIEFKICHFPPDWNLDSLRVTVDGCLFRLSLVTRDSFDRLKVMGTLDRPYKGRAPWSKIGFACLGEMPMGVMDNGIVDRRFLTISITEPRLIRT